MVSRLHPFYLTCCIKDSNIELYLSTFEKILCAKDEKQFVFTFVVPCVSRTPVSSYTIILQSNQVSDFRKFVCSLFPKVILFDFISTVAGVVPCGGRKKSPVHHHSPGYISFIYFFFIIEEGGGRMLPRKLQCCIWRDSIKPIKPCDCGTPCDFSLILTLFCILSMGLSNMEQQRLVGILIACFVSCTGFSLTHLPEVSISHVMPNLGQMLYFNSSFVVQDGLKMYLWHKEPFISGQILLST